MAKYIVKRVIMALITILVVACVTFVLMMSVPGSPFNDEKITPEQKAAMEAKYGMDDPLGVQMLRYLKGVIVDQDFGVSLKMQKDRPVLDIITEKFPLSAKIGVIALVWAVAVGIPLGCLAAYNRGKWVDSVLRVVCTLGVSMPGFVVATFLLMLFCNDGAPFKFMGINVIFDASQGAKAYLMPCLALGLYPMCYIARLTRSSMLDALGQDYIKSAGQGSADSQDHLQARPAQWCHPRHHLPGPPHRLHPGGRLRGGDRLHHSRPGPLSGAVRAEPRLLHHHGHHHLPGDPGGHHEPGG